MKTRESEIKFVIVGHIDHGKSTLIGRLLYETNSIPEKTVERIKEQSQLLGKELELSFIIDQLREERERAITIDTSQTFFYSDTRKYLLIDAPGHQEYLRNMITGTTHADFAMLVIAADQGVMEQTKRHAYLLQLLGIKNVICVINKIDTALEPFNRFTEIKDELLAYASTIDLNIESFVPISAYHGINIIEQNLNWFSGPSLLQQLEKLDAPNQDDLELRIVVQGSLADNSYCGIVAAGTYETNSKLFSSRVGEVSTSDHYDYDGGLIEYQQKGSQQLITFKSRAPLRRGDILTNTDQDRYQSSHRAKIFWMDDQASDHLHKPYTIRVATQKESATITKIYEIIDPSNLEQSDKLTTANIATIELSFSTPLFVDNDSNYKFTNTFVLENQGRQIAGGIFI